MRSIYLYLWVVGAVSGCAIFGGKKLVSDWQTLDEAKSIDCETFPKPKGVLRLRKISVLEGKTAAFIVEAVRRTGQKGSYFVPFDSDPEIDVDKFVSMDFGRDAMVVGGAGISKVVYVALLQKKGSKSLLEMRTLPDNVVRFKSAPLDFVAQWGRVSVTEKGIWLAYKEESETLGIEDAKVKVAFFSFGKKDRLRVRSFSKYDFPPNAALVVRQDKRKAHLVWGREGKSDKDYRFFMNELDPVRGRAEDPKRIEIPVKSSVESWAVLAAAGGINLAVVDGDSLVGQAKLMISKVKWRGEYTKVSWQKDAALSNEHVSEPIWLRFKNRSTLLLPKWVDAESTIATYNVGAGGTIKSGVSGIFPKGSRVMTGFGDRQEDDSYGLIRYRSKGEWQFEVCNFESF